MPLPEIHAAVLTGLARRKTYKVVLGTATVVDAALVEGGWASGSASTESQRRWSRNVLLDLRAVRRYEAGLC